MIFDRITMRWNSLQRINQGGKHAGIGGCLHGKEETVRENVAISDRNGDV